MSNFEEWFNNDDFFKDRSRSYKLSRYMPVKAAWNYQQEKIEKLESDNEKLRKCVEFYAGMPQWSGGNIRYDVNTGLINPFKDGTIYIGGVLARQTLKELNKE